MGKAHKSLLPDNRSAMTTEDSGINDAGDAPAKTEALWPQLRGELTGYRPRQYFLEG